ncbi:unnamed protein product [Meloidogyne enterolobii]|uniref:Uncharacterized protein n=1 Tax=Meloidogyne enterolobii TaxID=390850 RepID=A0ACB1ASX9_MELEN
MRIKRDIWGFLGIYKDFKGIGGYIYSIFLEILHISFIFWDFYVHILRFCVHFFPALIIRYF